MRGMRVTSDMLSRLTVKMALMREMVAIHMTKRTTLPGRKSVNKMGIVLKNIDQYRPWVTAAVTGDGRGLEVDGHVTY